MPDRARRPATMRDVAVRAGVSRSLVSTVFRGVPGASPATRARVLAAASDLGYRPDERARTLRSRESRLIGVTLTAVHPFHVAVTESLQECADQHGYQLSLSWTTQPRTLARAVDMLIAQRCAALVHVGPTCAEPELDALALLTPGVPTVVVDRFLTVPRIDALRVDDAVGIDRAVRHLARLGHRDIWYLDGREYVSAPPRLNGYLQAMRKHGLSEHLRVVPSGGTRADGAVSALDLLRGPALPTAFIAYNDYVAFGLMDVFSRHGIRIPEDISVVGFDDVPEARLEHLSLTTVEQRPDLLAESTVEIVIARLQGAPPTGLHLRSPGPLVIRSTTAPPRSNEV